MHFIKHWWHIGVSWAFSNVGIAINNGATTLSITALSIMTLSLKGLNVTLSISDAQHNNVLPLC
jgi:hypothetical protein